jgi:carboxymethylenebutenolidase
MGADLAAAVPFYGGVPPVAEIPKIKAAILVHQGELDKGGAASWPAYDQALTAANVPHEGYIYRAPFMASIAMQRRNATTKPQPT